MAIINNKGYSAIKDDKTTLFTTILNPNYETYYKTMQNKGFITPYTENLTKKSSLELKSLQYKIEQSLKNKSILLMKQNQRE